MPIRKVMKSIVIFYSDKNSSYAEKKAFGGKSARERSAEWAEKCGYKAFTVSSEQAGTIKELFSKMSQICEKEGAESVVFSYDDLPFLNQELTKALAASHFEYKAEYSYADGYPYGFSPEIIHSGTLVILASLAENSFADEGNKAVSRTGIFDFIKKDINSFEVNSILADDDWRLYRFCFDCGKKENYIASTKLFEMLQKSGGENSADELSSLASKNPEILKTIPGFYNIQISSRPSGKILYSPYEAFYQKKYGVDPLESNDFMPFEKISSLIEKIADFSPECVISLSAWGEAFYHPDLIKIIEKILSYQGLSVFIETNAVFISDELCSALKNCVENALERKNGWQKLMIAVSLDAFSDETYQKIHQNKASLEQATSCVTKLCSVLPDMVYPQFVRITDNESELESFFRFWNEKSSPSLGNLIIQKYNNFCGLLPERKTADLSPLERNVCWHLRRDMTILLDGTVPLCHCHGFEKIGNVFEEPLEEVWNKFNIELKNHIENIYCVKCRNCDEYYTFNF